MGTQPKAVGNTRVMVPPGTQSPTLIIAHFNNLAHSSKASSRRRGTNPSGRDPPTRAWSYQPPHPSIVGPKGREGETSGGNLWGKRETKSRGSFQLRLRLVARNFRLEGTSGWKEGLMSTTYCTNQPAPKDPKKQRLK